MRLETSMESHFLVITASWSVTSLERHVIPLKGCNDKNGLRGNTCRCCPLPIRKIPILLTLRWESMKCLVSIECFWKNIKFYSDLFTNSEVATWNSPKATKVIAVTGSFRPTRQPKIPAKSPTNIVKRPIIPKDTKKANHPFHIPGGGMKANKT